METISTTNFKLEHLKSIYRGKVRDIYHLEKDIMIMIVTDRISAFDVILPRAIPHKGQVLNQIANFFLDLTQDIVPNWKLATPDPNVTIGYFCKPIPVEMIVRGYLTGSSWREYKNGARNICGIKIPNGMREHEKFIEPIITPTTKSKNGHDENITKDEIIKQGIVSKREYEQMEYYALELYKRGYNYAKQRNLILVDTKYEFGIRDGKIFLIDEIHTPDSSRYFYANDYEERFNKGLSPRQLSKEFVREWLMENGFMGQKNEQLPELSDEFIKQISERYIELYETITGKQFLKTESIDTNKRIYENIKRFIQLYFN